MKKSRIYLPILAVASLFFADAASADSFGLLGPINIFDNYNRGQNTSVMERERPEYDAQGILAGGFTLLPDVETGLGYNSNVFAGFAPSKAADYFIFTPNLNVQSNWDRDSLNGSVGVDSKDYFSASSQNTTDWHANVTGQYDLQGDSYVAGGAQVRGDHILGTQDGYPVTALKPISVTTYDAFVRGVYQSGRTRLSAMTSISHQDYGSVPQTGGTTLSEASRDLNTFAIIGRGDFAVSPDTAVFAEAQSFSFRYTTAGPFNRTASEYVVSGGFNFDITALTRGELSLGYQDKSYQLFKPIKGLAVAAKLEYFPTPLTTITVTANRSIQDSILATTGGYLDSNEGLQIDHELLRNVILNLSATFENDDFRGIARHDNLSDIGGGGEYLLSQNVVLKGRVDYQSRDTSGAFAGTPFFPYHVVHAAITVDLKL